MQQRHLLIVFLVLALLASVGGAIVSLYTSNFTGTPSGFRARVPTHISSEKE